MFLSKTHLPHLLTPHHYLSEEQYRWERTNLFEAAWHPFAAVAEIPEEGDFVTRDLLGKPLILWNRGGRIQAFLNVCSHRFCKLTAAARGRRDNLQCQYHGWEYNQNGDVQRIPDAKSFRPLAQGELGLKPFATEVCGGMVFVSLNEDAPPLADFLGPAFEHCEQMTGGAKEFIMWDGDTEPLNWKLVMENAVESYHIDMVHSKSFGHYPDAKCCRHDLGEGWSRFTTWNDSPSPLVVRIGDWIERRLGVAWPKEYIHHHTYPHIMTGTFGPYGWVHTGVPTGPGEVLWQQFVFADAGESKGLANRIALAAMRRHGRRLFKQVMAEDLGVLLQMQQGLQCGEHPTGGMISIREERIWHFQRWILEQQAGEALPPPPGSGLDSLSTRSAGVLETGEVAR